METTLCILLRRPPYGQIYAAEAIRHMGGALAEGIQTNLVLVDDGVYVARDGQNASATNWTPLIPALAKVMAKGARVWVHTPSARARGLLKDEHFIIGTEPLDDAQLAGMLAGSDAVMVY
jgi:uncharacterized protein involved in oxidation of intracellular sulfur